jgi:hypothetical protein
MNITHVDHLVVHKHVENFHLSNLLHVSYASKNLVFVHRFTYDDRVFMEFHPFF